MGCFGNWKCRGWICLVAQGDQGGRDGPTAAPQAPIQQQAKGWPVTSPGKLGEGTLVLVSSLFSTFRPPARCVGPFSVFRFSFLSGPPGGEFYR